jgi:hypothetical protein
VRISAPEAAGDPEVITKIQDFYACVGADGVARVLYERVEGRYDWLYFEVSAGPEIFWNAVSTAGGASPPVSLGVVPDSTASWKGAFAPDGSACVATYLGFASDSEVGSFPSPLLVSPSGEVREIAGRVLPRVHCGPTGEQFAVAADAGSNFHLATFATNAAMPVNGRMKDIPPAAFLGTLEPGAEEGPHARFPFRGRVEHVWNFLVAEDGTRVIGGSQYVSQYHSNKRKRREDVTIAFADRDGLPLRRMTFRSPYQTNRNQPVLAASLAGGRNRYAAVWSGWWSPDRPWNRFVRVVLFEGE